MQLFAEIWLAFIGILLGVIIPQVITRHKRWPDILMAIGVLGGGVITWLAIIYLMRGNPDAPR